MFFHIEIPTFSTLFFLVNFLSILTSATDDGPSIERILMEESTNSVQGTIRLEEYENFAVKLRTSYYHPNLLRLKGRFSVTSPFNHGLTLFVQNLHLRMHPNGSCLDFLEISDPRRVPIRTCGRAINPLWSIKESQKPKGLIGSRFFDSPLGIINITIDTDMGGLNGDEDAGEYLMRENVIELVFTAYKKCHEPQTDPDLMECSFRKCIRAGLKCDKSVNCNESLKDEVGCSSEVENSLEDEEESLVNVTSRWAGSTLKPNVTRRKIELKPMGRNTTPLFIMIGVLSGIVLGVFVFCQWLGHSEAGKLIKNFGVREGLRRSFRRRSRRPARPKPISIDLEQSLNKDLDDLFPEMSSNEPYSKNSTLELSENDIAKIVK